MGSEALKPKHLNGLEFACTCRGSGAGCKALRLAETKALNPVSFLAGKN